MQELACRLNCWVNLWIYILYLACSWADPLKHGWNFKKEVTNHSNCLSLSFACPLEKCFLPTLHVYVSDFNCAFPECHVCFIGKVYKLMWAVVIYITFICIHFTHKNKNQIWLISTLKVVPFQMFVLSRWLVLYYTISIRLAET